MDELAETNNSVRTDLIEKNNPQLEEIYVEIKTEVEESFYNENTNSAKN